MAIFGSRCKEKAAIKEGIALMHASQTCKQDEKVVLKDSLKKYRKALPTCIELLRSMREASNVAAALNAGNSIQAFSSAYSTDDVSQVHLTPAENIRNHFRLKGWKSLSIEEQQWTLLDQEMHPLKYEWLREQEEEDRQRAIAAGRKPKKRKIAANVEAVRFSKVEIEHLLTRPFAMLSRKETLARKLLNKYHDSKGKRISQFMHSKGSYVASLCRAHEAEACRERVWLRQSLGGASAR